MAFQTPITIKKALDRIHAHEYVLPAIQREFVWKPEQIERLFDSLMRGYPIGSFLFWRVEKQNTRQYKFYDFVRNYHQKDAPHCPPLDVPSDSNVVAVLDGQQRLTALNIGLRGSHATKMPRLWWDNPKAFPERKLCLNLLAEADDDEEGKKYDFRFLTEEQAKSRDENHFWFRVSDILRYEGGADIFEFLHDNDLSQEKRSFRIVSRLHDVVHKTDLISFYEEDDQDLDRVLNIFIRTNSGGTVLSYSDLLLSIATAQWSNLDARKEIHDLVDELNDTRGGFNLTKDFVLKSGLMLADVGSVGFKVTNFNHDNMSILEQKWPRISDALRTTMRLVADFGYSGVNIGAINVLLPIAYYVYQRELDTRYLSSDAAREDRDNIKRWMTVSLLKSGIWGSGLDTLLTALRATIKEHGQDSFPRKEVEATMRARGKALSLEEEELQDLLDIKYGDRRVFALLSLLYPFIDFRNEFHVDHVFPKSRFTEAKLRKEGVESDVRDILKDRVDRLANLQLLDGPINVSKNDRLPLEWMDAHFRDDTARAAYVQRHDLGEVPRDIHSFNEFYEQRRSRLQARLVELLGSRLK